MGAGATVAVPALSQEWVSDVVCVRQVFKGKPPPCISYNLYAMGHCHKCCQIIKSCRCPQNLCKKVAKIIHFINDGEIAEEKVHNGITAVIIQLSSSTLNFFFKQLVGVNPNTRLTMAQYVFCELVYESRKVGNAIQNDEHLRHTLFMFCRAGLSLATRLIVFSFGDTALIFACKEAPIMALALLDITTENVDDENDEGGRALYYACYTESIELVKQLIERSNDHTLNYSAPPLLAPLFECINNYINGDTQELEKIRAFLQAACDDSSGVDLLGQREFGLLADEFVLDAIQGEPSEMQNNLLKEIRQNMARVRQGRSYFLPILLSAAWKWIPIQDLIFLIGSFAVPYFEEMRAQ